MSIRASVRLRRENGTTCTGHVDWVQLSSDLWVGTLCIPTELAVDGELGVWAPSHHRLLGVLWQSRPVAFVAHSDHWGVFLDDPTPLGASSYVDLYGVRHDIEHTRPARTVVCVATRDPWWRRWFG